MSALLAGLDIEVIFFLLMAVIALINKLYTKSKQIRLESQRQQEHREGRERLELVRVGAEVMEAPAPARKTRATPVAVRPPREAAGRPPRRTRRPRGATAPVASQADRTPAGTGVAARLRKSPVALREAIVLREILGPPVAMRTREFPRR